MRKSASAKGLRPGDTFAWVNSDDPRPFVTVSVTLDDAESRVNCNVVIGPDLIELVTTPASAKWMTRRRIA